MSENRGMHEIDMREASRDFVHCWQAAGRKLEQMAQGPIKGWLRSHLNPPFLEHLSFRIGNQLFFIRIEDADDSVEVPGSRAGLLAIASGCNGHACLMPMAQRDGKWIALEPGWGLLDALSGKVVDPASLVSEEKIEMTEWELHDFAVQVVRDRLSQQGRQLMSWQGNPSVDPSIWFVGDNGPEWVLVRAARFPLRDAERPSNLARIRAQCSHLSTVGYFASVVVGSSDDAFDPHGIIPATPLWRGHGLLVRFEGLSSVST
jgi:hypothetical protein